MQISQLKTKTVSNFIASAHDMVYNVYKFFSHIISGVTIGFDPATYTVNESAGNVSVTVNVLSGTLVRDMRVRLLTSLNGGTANGN